jgi:putative Mn2+ efflux pump MntP
MTALEIIMLAIGLAMDAFAVAVCKGLSVGQLKIRQYLMVGIWFGGFQALMPILGYGLGNAFRNYVQKYDNIISFIFLLIIGINMVREAFKSEETLHCGFGFFTMFLLSVATSIDAFAVGITIAFYNVNILLAAMVIGIITLLISVIGLRIGNLFGMRYRQRAQITGGAVLMLIGLKLLCSG